jgi:hypothetical protein
VEAIHQAVDLKATDIIDFGPNAADCFLVSVQYFFVSTTEDTKTYGCHGFRLRKADIESMANAVGGGRDTSQACTDDSNLGPARVKSRASAVSSSK